MVNPASTHVGFPVFYYFPLLRLGLFLLGIFKVSLLEESVSQVRFNCCLICRTKLPCITSDKVTCVPTYGYRHILSLVDDAPLFAVSVIL